MTDINRVKIVVLGDSGVGKTSLVQQLVCPGNTQRQPAWTVGCSVEIKLHDYKAGTPAETTYFVELWDVGGCKNHANSRRLFYQNVHGIILVHDLSNRKSEDSLRRWLAEVLDISCNNAKGGNLQSLKRVSSTHLLMFDDENFACEKDIPILVVGTKLDQCGGQMDVAGAVTRISHDCGAEEINLDCGQAKFLSAGTTNALKLTRFFDRVIERQHSSSKPHHGEPMSPERRRRKFL